MHSLASIASQSKEDHDSNGEQVVKNETCHAETAMETSITIN